MSGHLCNPLHTSSCSNEALKACQEALMYTPAIKPLFSFSPACIVLPYQAASALRPGIIKEPTGAEVDVCASRALNSGCVHDAVTCPLSGGSALECRGILGRRPALCSASTPPSQQQEARQHCTSSGWDEQLTKGLEKNRGEMQLRRAGEKQKAQVLRQTRWRQQPA